MEQYTSSAILESPATEDLPFTGERYHPSNPGVIHFEHWHRYVVARQFVAGKDVLDIASGEGYGSAFLTEAAGSVVGVDIDPNTVAHAERRYANLTNLHFCVGSCAAIPLKDASVDVVVSFETIEHHDQHQEMMLEIRRVLRPGGVLILSSPNRRVYTDIPEYHNPYHVHELYREELMQLIRPHFGHVRLYGQQATLGSFLFPLNGETEGATFLVEQEEGKVHGHLTEDFAVYFLAICSDREENVARPLASTFVSLADKALQTQAESLQWCESELRKHQEYLPRLERDFHLVDARRQQSESALTAMQAELERARTANEEAKARINELEERLSRIEAHPAVRLALATKKIISGKGH